MRGYECTVPVVDTAIAERGQFDAIMHEWLAPLVDRIGTLERENGRREQERAEAAKARVAELQAEAVPAPASAAPTVVVAAGAGSFLARVRRALGGG